MTDSYMRGVVTNHERRNLACNLVARSRAGISLGTLFFCMTFLLLPVLAGCAAGSPAPVVDKGVGSGRSSQASMSAATSAAPARPTASNAPVGFHDVQKGETLFSIAFQHGVDYREVAQWNGMEDANILEVGQRLRLTAPEGAPVATPMAAGSGIVVTPLGGGDQRSDQPIKSEPAAGALKTEPKAVKLTYSDKALEALQNPRVDKAAPQSKPAPDIKPDAKADSKSAETKPAAPSEDSVQWIWPTKGKPKVLFTESTKGIDITGSRGQLVAAAAGGKVIHVGSNLRGYGKLVIIQHSSMYLSAYAHNNNVLVKEGERVKKGQKIAEMGDSDTDQVKLHFEIRRFGKPVDPLKYLPEEKAS